jgi:YidC/Oxa1 family membrane protein insertase
LDFLGHLVQQFIALLYHFTGMLGYANYGVAIVLMTIIIKMALYPLTKKQIQSTKAMMELQPKLKQLQDRYKDDKMKLNEEVAKIYKASGVNPVAGCLPMLVHMPILFAIYYGVRDMVYEGPANFLWMSNIADPDKFYILPVLSAVTTYISSKQTMADNNSMQNQMMLYFMPLFIGYISLKFSAGLVIYWVVMNLMQIGQQSYMAYEEKKILASKGIVPKEDKQAKK